MKPVVVKNVCIGEGIPKICVPIVGTTREEILKEATEINKTQVDLIEWRADWYEEVNKIEKVKQVIDALRQLLPEIPILFTFRTAKEGGEKDISPKDYLELNCNVCKQGLVDLMDVELFRGDTVVKTVLKQAKESGIKVIVSNHDFEKTPCKEEIVERLKQMEELGADILKIAVMPNSKKDVLTLLEATDEMSKYATKPIVTMSMSGMGAISRLTGEIFGSAITFGTVKNASAPGQIPVKQLSQVLNAIHQL